MALLFTEAGSNVTLSAGGTVATKTGDSGFRNSVAVLGESMADGVHCWELEITKRRLNNLLVGVCKADVNVASTLDLYAGNKAWFIDCDRGDLYGNGAHGSDAAGGFTSGDRLGCRLDLGAGTLVYFKNGAPHGSGHTGVLGPVKRCIEMSTQKGTCVTVLEGAVIAVPAAEAPLGGGGAAAGDDETQAGAAISAAEVGVAPPAVPPVATAVASGDGDGGGGSSSSSSDDDDVEQ